MKVLLTCLLVLSATAAHADSGFVLARDVVSSGGGTVTAGGTSLRLTAGEALVGTSRATDWAQATGFWALIMPTLLVDVPEVPSEAPVQYALHPGAPNPSSGRTAIRYVIPASAGDGVLVSLRVFDISGRLVRVLEDGLRAPGVHVATWDGRSRSGSPVGAGVYLCRMQAGGFAATRRLVVIR